MTKQEAITLFKEICKSGNRHKRESRFEDQPDKSVIILSSLTDYFVIDEKSLQMKVISTRIIEIDANDFYILKNIFLSPNDT